MKTDNNDFVMLNAGISDGECAELTELELNLILGGYEPGYNENPDPDGNGRPGEVYNPHPPGDIGLPGSGGLPPGAPGILQPGGGETLGETLRPVAEGIQDAVYYSNVAIAEGLDIASAATPFPLNYVLDKLGDAVRPTESSAEEYRQNH